MGRVEALQRRLVILLDLCDRSVLTCQPGFDILHLLAQPQQMDDLGPESLEMLVDIDGVSRSTVLIHALI